MNYIHVSKIAPILGLAALTFSISTISQAQDAVRAELSGHVVLPAATFTKPPVDAPALFKMSGRYLHSDGRRRDKPGSIPGIAFLSDPKAPRPTGLDGPFVGQPIQGFSGIRWQKDGTAWVLSDNGFGNKVNSPDAMLMLHLIQPQWASGKLNIKRTIFLHDPDGIIPFNVVNAGTVKRYLTGADLDIESIQPIGDSFWIGDEFGPYLIRTDREGKVTGFFETRIDGKVVRSPDHFNVSTPATPGNFTTPVRRSRGFEGMAASRDGKYLYPMLEGPMWNPEAKGWENQGGRDVLRVLEFDVEKAQYTSRSWLYPIEIAGNNIGDFNMIDANTALVIERDNGEGDAARACPPGEPRPDCFNAPAKFKRVYKIELGESGGMVRKIAYVDLLNIEDPKRVARIGGSDGRFSLPHWCIEGVDIVDGEHIVVLNDNNFGVSAAREFGKNEPNEIALLRVPELLRAR